jgi:hypothetical protein
VLEEHASSVDRSRPALTRLLRDIRRGETLVVVRLDRPARSVSHLLAVIEQLETNGAHFRSLHDPIDTSTPQGMFSLQVLGAVAQLERALIAERTKAGLQAARRRGRLGGNPGLRARDPGAIRKVRASRDKAHLDGILAQLDSWLPTVRRMRPDQPWGDVVRVLNRGQAARWTVERLRRTIHRLVGEGILEVSLLDRARTQPSDDRLVRLVAGIKAAAPDRTLQQIPARGHARTDAAMWDALAPLFRQALAGPGRTARFDQKRDGVNQAAGRRVLQDPGPPAAFSTNAMVARSRSPAGCSQPTASGASSRRSSGGRPLGRADLLIVFGASALVGAAMDASGIPHQALRNARAADTLVMSQPVFDEVIDVLHRPRLAGHAAHGRYP